MSRLGSSSRFSRQGSNTGLKKPEFGIVLDVVTNVDSDSIFDFDFDIENKDKIDENKEGELITIDLFKNNFELLLDVIKYDNIDIIKWFFKNLNQEKKVKFSIYFEYYHYINNIIEEMKLFKMILCQEFLK